MVIVTEIRDNIEVVHSPEYGSFLTYMFPVFYNVLRQGVCDEFALVYESLCCFLGVPKKRKYR